MSNNTMKQASRTDVLKNEATRQRWELFHLAIAYAKQSAVSDLEDSSALAADEHPPVRLSSVVS